MNEYPILSSEHALLAGFVWGLAIKHGLQLQPIQDADGNYTAAYELIFPEDSGFKANARVVVVVPPPLIETEATT